MMTAGAVLLCLCAVLSLFAGNFHVRDANDLIIYQVRLPRMVSAILCAFALASSGMLLQTALNNPLCSPGIMGINSGAGFFLLISGMIFPFSALSRQMFGFAGAVIATLLVYAVCNFAGFSRATLILTGVAVSSLFTAGSNAVITVRPQVVADKTAFSLGGFSVATWTQIAMAVPWIILGLIIVIAKADHIGLLCLGDESAAGLGVKPDSMRKLALMVSAMLAGSAVCMCGMLGFVGLIIPNLIRRAGNFSVRRQLMLCCVFSGSFLLVCDMLSRYLFFPYELPVGLFMSFLGSPFFIWILIKKRRGAMS